jgi:hypothetical protein
MFIVNGKTDPPYNNKWVSGGCETVCKSGCFDRVTLSDDDGRCNHSFSTARAGARRASGGIEPGGPRPPSVALRLPAGGPAKWDHHCSARGQKSASPRPPVAVVVSLLSACASPAHSTVGGPAPPFGPGHQFIS